MNILAAVVAKGSPKMNMVGRASPKLSMCMAMVSYSKKKNSPKGSGAKNSPKGMFITSCIDKFLPYISPYAFYD
jgi:hypothetical protein